MLRIKVFREYPYLYDGSLDYERDYLRPFLESAGSVLIVAADGKKLVGASTASPLSQALPEVRDPFRSANRKIVDYLYLGESVLLPAYRGLGVGHVFFNERERMARASGLRKTAFCAVVRPGDDPRKPEGYKPLDEFWGKRGYQKIPNLTASFRWKEVGAKEETAHDMVFWEHQL